MGFWKKWSRAQKKSTSVPVWMLGTGVGIILLVLGAYHEQFVDIYRKAVMICLECIGIG